MCYDSVQAYSNSKLIPVDLPHQFVTTYSCSKCLDCLRQLRSQWSMRAFYEAKDLFDHNSRSFVLFDTLTYDDDNLKYFHDIYPAALYNCWDFMAFSRDDVKRFFKRLRINLSRDLYDVDGNLRYFLTSEYGSDKYYYFHGKLRKATHRPHYHILFYVNFEIDPLVLSRYISDAWTCGITDGVEYKGSDYVLYKRVIRSSNSLCIKLVNYVSKYVSKNLYLYNKLYRRCFKSFTIHNPNWFESYSKRLEFRRFKNQVLPFHLQSRGFGLAALDYEDERYLEENFAVRMPISNGIVASIPLGGYLLRKKFYNLIKINGKLSWLPTAKYLRLKKRRLLSNVVNYANRLIFNFKDLSVERAKEISMYNFIWRGKYVPKDYLLLSDSQMMDEVFSMKKVVSLLNGKVFVNNNVPRAYYDNNRGVIYNGRVFSQSEFINCKSLDYVVVDSCVPRFAGFDDYIIQLRYYDYCDGKAFEFEAFNKEVQEDRYKTFGFVES